MTFLNDFDIQTLTTAAAQDHFRPNLQKAALTLWRLQDWANDNSDGWHSWPKPSRASQKLQQILYFHYLGRDIDHPVEDITAAQLKAAESPIRAFLTRQGVDHRAVFLND